MRDKQQPPGWESGGWSGGKQQGTSTTTESTSQPSDQTDPPVDAPRTDRDFLTEYLEIVELEDFGRESTAEEREEYERLQAAAREEYEDECLDNAERDVEPETESSPYDPADPPDDAPPASASAWPRMPPNALPPVDTPGTDRDEAPPHASGPADSTAPGPAAGSSAGDGTADANAPRFRRLVDDAVLKLRARREAVRLVDEEEAKARRGDGEADEPLFADVAQLLAGGPIDFVPRTFGLRTDGEFLFYKGKVNVIFGDPESGKTWIALYALAEGLKAGQRGVVVDIDHNGPGAIVQRLRLLGVSDEVLVDQQVFRYADPQDVAELREVVAALVVWQPAVAVVDSIGELLPLLGLSSNSPDDFTVANAAVLQPLANVGACVLAIDHLAKNADSRALGPTGTIAKKRTVRGSSLRVVAVQQFTPGEGGKAALTIHKDTNGALRAVCPPASGERSAGTFVMTATGACFVAAPGEQGGDGQDDGAAAGLVEMSSQVIEVINMLNKLGVPETYGRVKARKALAAAGFSVSNADVSFAIKMRKTRAEGV